MPVPLVTTWGTRPTAGAGTLPTLLFDAMANDGLSQPAGDNKPSGTLSFPFRRY